MDDLWHCGLYAEPTCAIAAAALSELARRGSIRPEDETVVVLTGTGLKATQRVLEHLELRKDKEKRECRWTSWQELR